MSVIQPSPGHAPRPGATGTAPRKETGPNPSFAGLLGRGGPGRPLSASVAHLFNEFGFFANVRVEPVGQKTPGGPAFPGNTAADRPGSAAQSDEAPGIPGAVPGEALSQGTEASAGQDRVHQPQPTIRLDRRQNTHPVSGQSLTGAAAPAPNSARSERDDISDKAASGKGGKEPPARGEPVSDRLTFRIGNHVVDIAGRLAGLALDEERRLLEALSALLESHGLSLGSATLNGRPFPSIHFRRNS